MRIPFRPTSFRSLRRIALGISTVALLLTATVTPIQAQNLIDNPSGETDANNTTADPVPTSWTESPNTLADGTENDWGAGDFGLFVPPDGANAFVPAGESPDLQTTFNLQQDITGSQVTGGATYDFSGQYATASASADEVRVLLEFRDGNGTVLDTYSTGWANTGGTFESFSTTKESPSGTALIRVRLQGVEGDPSLGTDVGIDALDLRATNLPPDVSTNAGSSTDEDTDDQITQSELETTDPEQGPSSLTYTIDTDVSEGQIQNTGKGVQLNQSDEFTQADINNGYIEYRHDGSEPTSEYFDFTVRDGSGGSARGTFSITINQVNDAPSIAGDLSISTDEGTAVTLTSTDLEADDPDDSGSALTYTVTSAPSNGTITVNGSAASTFTEADVNNRNVEYLHDGSETTSDAFDVELADDDGGTSGTATVSVTVSSTNDAPTLVSNTPLSLRQGSKETIPQRLLETTDTESGPSSLTYTIDTDVSQGQIQNTGIGIQLNQSDEFTQAEVNNDYIEYRHDGSGTRSDYFEFTVRDGDGGSVFARFDVVISPPPYGSGTALMLDGSGDYVSTGAGGDALGLVNESFSIGVWFRLDSSGDERTLVGMDDPETNNKTLVIGEENGQFLFAFFGNDLSGGSVPTGEWVHATFVYDATRPDGENDRFIYKNGVQVAAGEASGDFQGTDELLIGRNREGNYFDGKIDQVRVWEGALTKSQVRTRARRTIDVEGTVERELVAAWRFDAGSGTTAYDVIAGRDGTLQGDAGFTSVSGAGFGQASAALQSGAQTVGPAGGSVAASNVSTSGSDDLQVYQYGTTSGPTLDGNDPGEDFSGTSASKRLNVVWGLEPIGSSPSADVTLDYSQVQGLSDPSNVRLLKRARPGDAWQNVSDNWTWDSGNRTFSKSGVSSFSQYAIGEASSPLPVELVSLDGRATENGVRLTWRTASETNNAGFRVQRQDKTGDWTEVGAIEGAGTTTNAQSYRFTDTDLPYEAEALVYRLKQIDTDGSVSHSEEITIDRSAVKQVQLLGTYPNPARNRATVRFAIPEGKTSSGVTLRLYDTLGRQVRTVQTAAEAGRHTLQLETSRLPSGVYFLRLQAGSTVKTQRLTVVQ